MTEKQDTSDHVRAFEDSARDMYAHLERAAQAVQRDAANGALSARSPDTSRDGKTKAVYGKLAPLADARLLWRAMADAGWLGILVDEARSGMGLGMEEVLAVADMAGRHPRQPALLVSAIQIASCLDGVPATEGGQQRLQDFLAGECLAGLAWQEMPGQLDAAIANHAMRLDAAGSVLSGRKLAVSPLAACDGWIVHAQSPRGPMLAWVARNAPGVRIVPDDCTDGSDIGTLYLEGVAVRDGDVLLRGDGVDALVALACDRARLVQAAMMNGLADQVLQQTLDYLRTRVQFGKALGSFQALQHRCVDLYMETQIARECIEDVLHRLERATESTAYLSSRAKARSAAMALRVTRSAIQLHGAIGVTDELPISGFFRRALHLSAWLGNAGAHLRRCARLRVPRSDATEQLRVHYPADAPLEDLDDAQFRAAVRDFLESNFPKELRFLPRNAKWSEWKPWFQTLSRKGWAAPSWPKEHGGLALPQDRVLAILEEQESFGVPRAPTENSVGMLGPLLIQFGTEYQKRTFLPDILAGETIWCQGYSEPNAGSDLASLRTSARLEGDTFFVNGQKIWTSIAADATHMFALVRTREGGAKQAGISFLLIDMESPGLTVRPIRDMAGHDKFCEVFFDNVPVPLANLVGPMHDGWTVAKTLLGHERVTIGSPHQARVALYQLESLGRARGMFDDPVFALRFSELEHEALDAGALYRRFAGYIKRGEPLPASVPLAKLWATETWQRITAYTVEVAAEDGQNTGMLELGAERIGTVGPCMSAIFSFIYAGTNDIQRNILARQVLRLPA